MLSYVLANYKEIDYYIDIIVIIYLFVSNSGNAYSQCYGFLMDEPRFSHLSRSFEGVSKTLSPVCFAAVLELYLQLSLFLCGCIG